MKKSIVITSIILGSMVLALKAGAMEIESVKVSDVSNSIVTVKGSVEKGNNNRLATVWVSKDGDSSPLDRHIDLINIQSDGAIDYSFKFTGETAKYTVSVSFNDEKIDTVLDFTNIDELKTFIEELSAGKISDVYDGINNYSTSLGVNMEKFSSDKAKNLLVKRVQEKYSVIKSELDKGNLNEIASISQKAERELQLLDELEKNELWNNVNGILTKYIDIIDINFDKYNTLNSNGRMNVDAQFTKKSFKDADELTAAYENAVNAEILSQNTNNNNGGGSGSGGSGGGGGSWSGTGGSSSSSSGFGGYVPLNSSPAPAEEAIRGFNDVGTEHWAYNAITYLADKDIISGMGDGYFNPDGTITREEFIKMLVLAFNLYDETAKTEFEDVAVDSWYYGYVASAYKAGVVSGIDEKHFGTGMNVSRQDIAVMLYRTAKATGVEFSDENTEFNDFESISDYAREAVSYMSGKGIINGIDGEFLPLSSATRAQGAKMIYELLREE